MPFRGGTAAREKIIQINLSRALIKGGERHKWTPGLVFGGPIPRQPWWLFNVDVIFIANLLYVLGSILYVVQALYFVHSFHLSSYDDDYNPKDPSNYLNLGGAALFIANALASFLDWWLCTRTASIMNAEVAEDVIPSPSPTVESSPIVAVSMTSHLLLLYFLNNLFFLFAAVIFQIQGVWLFNVKLDRYGCMHTECGDFALPLLGNLLYLVSSLFSVAEFYENQSTKRSSTKMFPGWRASLADVDWFGWGDWLYFCAALIPCVQSFWSNYYHWTNNDDENRQIGPYYLFNQLIWLLDSIVYMLGYYYFMVRVVAAANSGIKPTETENPIVSAAEFREDDL